jgi:uncharacterized protein YegL
MQDQAIAGYNDFLQNQIQYPGDTRFSLTLFNDQIQQVAHWVPVQEMVRLNTDSYIPSGNTALDDAVGITIDSLGAELAKMPEHERPGKVIVAILTDGQENSSLRYTTKKVASMIRRQTKHYQWEFLFLGAGPNVERESSARGISSLDTLCFEPTPEGISEVMSNLNFNVNQRKRR